jgi:hypothetical protein
MRWIRRERDTYRSLIASSVKISSSESARSRACWRMDCSWASDNGGGRYSWAEGVGWGRHSMSTKAVLSREDGGLSWAEGVESLTRKSVPLQLLLTVFILFYWMKCARLEAEIFLWDILSNIMRSDSYIEFSQKTEQANRSACCKCCHEPVHVPV